MMATFRLCEAQEREFLRMLPAIERCAQRAFACWRPEARAEAVAAVVANAFVAYRRLAELGKAQAHLMWALTRFAVRQVREGRSVGTQLNVRDVTSHYCQRAKQVRVERLEHYDSRAGEWIELLVDDKRATPAEVAVARLDVAAWLWSLHRRQRQIASALALGETTSEAARRFRLSPGRISQIRQELRASWACFQGEAAA